MKVAVIMHDRSEGPGTIGEYLGAKGIEVSLVRLYAGEHLPHGVEGLDGVVSLGGPMNVYEEARYLFLREETVFLTRAISQHVPILGICLGAQMIARACGASVDKASVKELGWDEVTLTARGKQDALFASLPGTLTVFQWHEDTFAVPDGGHLLASSPKCSNQAFRYGSAYGLQFHPEVTPPMLAEWFGSGVEGKEMLGRLEIVESEYVKQALRLYANFVQIMKLRKVQVSSGQKAWASPAESESFWPISPATTHTGREKVMR
jgi:GMP synthase (glutamine-hydrolysing)